MPRHRTSSPPARLAAALLLAVGLLVWSSPGASAQDRLDTAAVDRWVTDYLEAEGLPGAAVAVVHDGQVVVETGHGTDDAPVTATTPMSIGSVSKMITAFAVLQLVERGEIELDGSVAGQMPEFDLDDPRGARITVRQLLTHTSGLPNPLVVAPAADPEERVAGLRAVPLVSDPGSRHLYSNLGYHVAARLVETRSGEPFATYLERHVFAPLGMTSSRSEPTAPGRPGLDGGHVTAYGGALALPEMEAMTTGSGSVVSTAHDMALWLAMQQRGGVAADGTRLLSEDLLIRSRTPEPGETYAFGWQQTTTSEPPRVGHDGALTRYSARAELVPSSGYGVVVILDSYTALTKHPFEIAAGVVALSEGRTPTPGAPLATIVDAVLGALTVLVGALGVTGLRRSRAWAERRSALPRWRLGLRLLPQVLAPVAAMYVFVALPAIDGNSATARDVFGLFPALMVLLAVSALVGAALTIARLLALSRTTASARDE